jgi:hypothetical protein
MLSSPPLLALLYDFAQIRNRPYLNRSTLHAWMLRHKLNRMIEVSRLKDVKTAELFLCFRIGAVDRRDFAVFPVQGQRGLGRLKRDFGNNMSVGAQMVVVLKACVEHCVSLVLGHPFEFSWLDVSQTDIFHCSSPLGGSAGIPATLRKKLDAVQLTCCERAGRDACAPGANVY